MKHLSFRIKLTLWNVAVLAVVLGAFGVGIVFAAQAKLEGTLERELLERARRFTRMVPPQGFEGFGRGGQQGSQSVGSATAPSGGPPQGGQPGAPQGEARGQDPNRSQGPRGGGEPRRGGGQGEGQGFRPFGVQSPGFDPQTERLAALRRPRFLDKDGKGLGPYGLGPWDQAGFEAALAGREHVTTVTAEGQSIRVVSAPISLPDGTKWVVQVGRELTDVEQGWGRQFGTLATLLPIALLVAAFGGLFLTGRALRPVRAVTHAASNIGAQDLSQRLEVEGKDEIAELAETFNGMIARLEQSFDRQRRFTADASHELRTPLTRIKLATSSSLEGEPDVVRYRRALEVADTAADAMSRLVQQLLLLARADAGRLELQFQVLEIATLAREAADSVPELATERLRLELPPAGAAVSGDPEMLKRVVANLLENAARHTPQEGLVRLSATVTSDSAVLVVSDSGEGIAPEHLPHLTERFYRVDTARSRADGGCGLGLAITKGIVEAHGGTLLIESELGKGTSVTVTLPLARDARSIAS